MFDALLKAVTTVASGLRDVPAFIAAVGGRMDKQRRERAIRDLRALHFSPKFRDVLDRASQADYAGQGSEALAELAALLEETAVPVAEAADRLLEFADEYADLPFSDFNNLYTLVDGKATIRQQVTRLAQQLRQPAAQLPNSEQVEQLQTAIAELNKAIGQTHEVLRLLGVPH